MDDVPDESVHLVVTSPPYWQLKDYGSGGQIGFFDRYEEYINNLNLVWKECGRVLHGGCRLCVNIGDQFARAVYYGKYRVIPIRTEIIKFCETIGFDYLGAVIWQKVTTTNTTGGATVMGSYPYPRNGVLKIDYEFILLFKKDGTSPRIDREQKERSRLTKEEWNTYFRGHWNFSGAKQDNHLAMFPEELPRRLIKMFSFVGETVLDPFLGSGTTTLAAKNLGRNSIGYEINPEFLPVIREKVGAGERDLFHGTAFSFVIQPEGKHDFSREIETLPYRFSDPHGLSNKIDPRTRRYGSKIDKNSRERENYYRVEKIISPELLTLDNGETVRLIGIRQNPEQREKAVHYLADKTRGQKIFLKYDAEKYDDHHHLLAYLYLSNKTFINAHLLKEGLALVDRDAEFRHKEKFINCSSPSTR